MLKCDLEKENKKLRKMIREALESMENNGMGHWTLAKKLRAALTAGQRE